MVKFSIPKIRDIFSSFQNERSEIPEKAIDLGQSYRLQMWTSRTLLIVCIGLFMSNIFLALCISFLLPLKEIQPMFLTTNDRVDQIVKVEPVAIGKPSDKLLSEKMARKYLIKRETVDLQTEEIRHKQVQLLSSADVFKTFKNVIENDDDFLKKATEDKLTRSILVKSISWLTDNKMYIEYEAVDSHFDQETDRRVMVAVITFEYRPQRIKYEDVYLNPVGWTVIAYSLNIKHEGVKNENI